MRRVLRKEVKKQLYKTTQGEQGGNAAACCALAHGAMGCGCKTLLNGELSPVCQVQW